MSCQEPKCKQQDEVRARVVSRACRNPSTNLGLGISTSSVSKTYNALFRNKECITAVAVALLRILKQTVGVPALLYHAARWASVARISKSFERPRARAPSQDPLSKKVTECTRARVVARICRNRSKTTRFHMDVNVACPEH
eukprot:2426202-Pyramimonas_sp.AAC.1